MFLFAKLMSIKRKMQVSTFGCAEAEKFPRSLSFPEVYGLLVI